MTKKKTSKKAGKKAPAKKAPTRKNAAKKTAAKRTASRKTAVNATRKKAAPTSRARKAGKKSPPRLQPVPGIPEPERIAEAAYLLYLDRLQKGLPGDEESDWLAAEMVLARGEDLQAA